MVNNVGHGGMAAAQTSFSPAPGLDTSHGATVLSTKALADTCDVMETRGPRDNGSGSPAPPGRTYECEDVCRKSTMTVFSVLGLTVMVMGYLVIGAVTFSILESRHASEDTSNSPTVMNSNDMLATLSSEVNSYIDELREHTVSKLWQMTEQMNILYPVNWTHNAAEELLSFQRMLSRKLATEIMSRPIYPNAKPSASGSFHSGHTVSQDHSQWAFSRGFLYSLNLLTTIGMEMGNLQPNINYCGKTKWIYSLEVFLIVYKSSFFSFSIGSILFTRHHSHPPRMHRKMRKYISFFFGK